MRNRMFIGRESELATLNSVLRKKTASLVVVKGRRRVGKSRLIEEFAKKLTFYRFMGLAPNDKITAQDQRDHFSFQLNQQTGLPEIKTDDWSKLFSLLFERTKTGRVIVFFDEITWMAADDPTFLSKLHHAWEAYYKNNLEFILILCGSVSAWIEKNILSSTGYFGRISINLTLKELPLNYSNALLMSVGFKGSNYEKLMLFAVMGGIPWYLEQVDPGLSAIENIKKLCFTKDGLLVNDFKFIFHDLFGALRGKVHRNIIDALADGPADYEKISSGVNYISSGPFSEYLNELILSGFICRDYIWAIKTGKTSSLSKYRLSDNYLRFYIKYIAPKLDQIDKQQFINIALASLPGWDSIIGLQFENLVLNNRALMYQALQLDPNHVVNDNPYFQRKNKVQNGCQIDYLIQTKFNTLYICEIKFSTKTLTNKVINEVKEKINKLKLPKEFSCLPVLIVANEVSQKIVEENYFAKIIDLRDFLIHLK